MHKIQCPCCGAKKHKDDEYQKVFVCDYCTTRFTIENMTKIKHSLLLKSENIHKAGKHYQLIDALELHHKYGIRTEWSLIDNDNQHCILTEEDENFSLVKKCSGNIDKDLSWSTLRVNTEINLLNHSWLVTEQIELNLLNNLHLRYCYLTGVNAELLVLIFTQQKILCRQGFWLDAFDINNDLT